MNAVAKAFADYGSEDAHKLLSDNRARYMRQSKATRDGKVAEIEPELPSFPISQDDEE